MENTSYIALSRQVTLRRQMSVIANNLANMNTTGFKSGRMMFTDHVIKSRGGERIMGERLAYARDIATVRDFTEGGFDATGNPLDLAIHGDGWFTVQTEEGTRYTRAGRLRLDETGQLVTLSGNPVLSDNGEPFIFASGQRQISVARDGTISTQNGTLGKLGLARFDNPHQLKEVSGGLFRIDPDINDPNAQAKPAENVDVAQNMTEKSNVQGIAEMTRMIEVNRAYRRVKNLIEKEDDRIKKMSEEVSRPL